MLHVDDPIAKGLFEKFNEVRMSNLSVNEDEAADILACADAQTAARS